MGGCVNNDLELVYFILYMTLIFKIMQYSSLL